MNTTAKIWLWCRGPRLSALAPWWGIEVAGFVACGGRRLDGLGRRQRAKPVSHREPVRPRSRRLAMFYSLRRGDGGFSRRILFSSFASARFRSPTRPDWRLSLLSPRSELFSSLGCHVLPLNHSAKASGSDGQPDRWAARTDFLFVAPARCCRKTPRSCALGWPR